MTDPRSGPSPSDAALPAIPGGNALSSTTVSLASIQARAEIRRRKHLNEARVLRAAWDQLEHVFDLLVEMFVSLQHIHGGLYRANCTLCRHSSHVDLYDRTHVGHEPNCLIARLCAARLPVESASGSLIASLSQPLERRPPDTPEREEPAAVERPSPAPNEVTQDTGLVTRIGPRPQLVSAAGKAAAR